MLRYERWRCKDIIGRYIYCLWRSLSECLFPSIDLFSTLQGSLCLPPIPPQKPINYAGPANPACLLQVPLHWSLEFHRGTSSLGQGMHFQLREEFVPVRTPRPAVGTMICRWNSWHSVHIGNYDFETGIQQPWVWNCWSAGMGGRRVGRTFRDWFSKYERKWIGNVCWI